MTNKYLVFHSIITGLKPENKNAYETSVFCCGAQVAGCKMISGRYGTTHGFVHSRYENRLHFSISESRKSCVKQRRISRTNKKDSVNLYGKNENKGRKLLSSLTV